MSRENVVPFELFSRAGMSRRGAPDKRQSVAPATFQIECPRCAAVFRFEPDPIRLDPEILCTGCDTMIPLAIQGRADSG